MEDINELDIAGVEVYQLLQYLPREKYYKIPKKITSLFEKYKDYNIKTKIDKNKRYEEQEISQKARDVIFYISLNYWLTEEEKNRVIEKMKQNEAELEEKYSVEKIFQTKKENVAITVQEKQNVFTKIINCIKRIFGKN